MGQVAVVTRLSLRYILTGQVGSPPPGPSHLMLTRHVLLPNLVGGPGPGMPHSHALLIQLVNSPALVVWARTSICLVSWFRVHMMTNAGLTLPVSRLQYGGLSHLVRSPAWQARAFWFSIFKLTLKCVKAIIYCWRASSVVRVYTNIANMINIQWAYLFRWHIAINLSTQASTLDLAMISLLLSIFFLFKLSHMHQT